MIRLRDGTEIAGEGCFLEVIENERIVFTDALRGGWRPKGESFFFAIIEEDVVKVQMIPSDNGREYCGRPDSTPTNSSCSSR